jgi:hypothetical protein
MARKKFLTPWKFFLALAKKAQRFKIFSSLSHWNLPSEIKFLRAIFFSMVEARKNYVEEKFFSSAPKFWSNIFPGFKKILSAQKKYRPFIWIEWEKSPRNFFARPFQQFQVLFYSPFEILFIFPSQYFFAIGLLSVFSFWWITPPVLSCISKQLDSKKPKIFLECAFRKSQGYHLLWHCFPADLFSEAQEF